MLQSSLIDGGGAPVPTLAELAAKAEAARINASQNTGGGADARYDQAQYAAAQAALLTAQAAADKAAAEAKAASDKAIADAKTAADKAAAEAKAAEEARIAALLRTSSNLGGTNPIPNYSTSTTTSSSNITPIKTATPQYILFNDDLVPIDAMVDLLFERIGGQELLTIARADTVNGQKILYQPIKNLNILKEQYNPNNIVRLQNTSDKYFNNFSIKLGDKIPVVGNGSNGDNVYIDSNGDLVIEFVNLENDEQAEIEITASGIIAEVGI